jgi:alkylhydroperoxidase family enzyme
VTRIPLVDPNDPDLDPAVRRLFAATFARAEALGATPLIHNVTRALANHPAALRAIGELSRVGYIDGLLPKAERELAYLTTSVANSCHY